MSLQHILAAEPEEPATPLPPPDANTESASATMPPPSSLPSHEQPTEQPADGPKSDDAVETDERTQLSSTTTSVRRNANGNVSSVYSGNKLKHLKKEDGIPLWRKDIQYDFLRLVFYDETKCFTKCSDGTNGHTFADVYIDAMAKSSKCSKILKEKLLQDQEGAISMAMVCLLVNFGRMNTTLNCKMVDLSSGMKLIAMQSSLKCAHSCGPITQYRLYKRIRIRMHTSSCKTLRV